MFLFYLKKNFCDGWDSMLHLVVVNFFILLYGVAALLIIDVIFKISFLIAALAGLLLFALGMILVFAGASCAAQIAGFDSPAIRDFFSNIPTVAADGFRFGLLYGTLILAGAVGIPSYFSMGNMVGFICAVFLFWVEVIALLAFQWFIPIKFLMHNSFKKCLKKSFIILFDNFAFSVFLGVYTLFLAVLSLFLFFLMPSFSGIALAHINALRLRLYKYDWLEKQADAASDADALKKLRHARIPWDELLAEDKELVGPRPLKSFIFPWKY